MLARVVRLSLLLVLELWGFLYVAPGDGYKASVAPSAESFPPASEEQSIATTQHESLVTDSERKALENGAEASRVNPSAEEKKFLNCSLEDLSACQLNNLPGEMVNLKPAGSIVVPLTGTIQFIATLINPHNKAWKVIGELRVKKADGSVLTLLAPREIRLARGQTLTLPVDLPADPSTFPPGKSEFIAILRDVQGNLIDQASITFILTLDIKK